MSQVVGPNRLPLLQLPRSPSSLAVGQMAPAKRLLVPLAGVSLDVAQMQAVAGFSGADMLALYLWPFVMADATCTAAISRYTNLPWLWQVSARVGLAPIAGADVVVPAWPPNANPADATRLCDPILTAGGAMGLKLNNTGGAVAFRLSIDDAVTYPTAHAIIEYALCRTAQG